MSRFALAAEREKLKEERDPRRMHYGKAAVLFELDKLLGSTNKAVSAAATC